VPSDPVEQGQEPLGGAWPPLAGSSTSWPPSGWPSASPIRGDGRSSFAVVTPAGKNALRRAWPVYREAIRRLLGTRLTAQQCRDFAALLEQAVARTATGISGTQG
jgi:hypothetical protein